MPRKTVLARTPPETLPELDGGDPALSREAYQRRKDRENARQGDQSRRGRDIGPIPAVADLKRKAACRRNFRRFCETYFPATFYLGWSPDHRKVIAKIEQAVLHGTLVAIAMPRGSGKSSLCETACLWAELYGHRDFVALVGADEPHAQEMLDSIASELENNDLLAADFPEVCFPIRSLEGIHQRASGQLCEGQRTHIGWTAEELILPTVKGSRASGAIIRVAGITGRIRGMKAKRPDGKAVRPSLVLIDDPQTDESARSPSQCATRERILSGAILGLAGPGKKIAGLMTLTVVTAGDLADRMLDRSRHPAWQGERTKMVYAFPTDEKLWQQYAFLRAEGQRNERGTAEADAFYRQHRKAMDAGAEVAWPARKDDGDLSAIQHVMNLRFDRGDAAFFAEYQNEPQSEIPQEPDSLTVDAILGRCNGVPRGRVPLECSRLTAFVDVQGAALFWLVAGLSDNFGGAIVDYGCYPSQGLPYFTLRDIKRTLQVMHKGTGQEGAIYAGLQAVTASLLGKDYQRADGTAMRIERCPIDANWGASTDVVYQFCRQSPFAAIVLPSHGRYVGAASRPFSDWPRRPGERIGLNWRIPVGTGARAVRHVLYDTNAWKSVVASRLATPMGEAGALTVCGTRGEVDHRMLADHLTAETRIRTQGRGRQCDEWRLRQPGLDNHWWDCLVGAFVAASIQGVQPMSATQPVKPKRRFSEVVAARRSA